MKIDEAKDALTAWSRNGKFIAKTERSKNIIMQALKLCKNPYVSFSCGKDSSVLAHLVLDIKKDVPLRFLSSGETRLVHNVDRIIEHFKDKGAVIHEINIDRVFSPEWKDATWTEQVAPIRERGLKHQWRGINGERVESLPYGSVG